MNRILTCLWISCAILFPGCGYSTSSVLPSIYRTIYVTPFKNSISYSTDKTYNTYFPLLEVNVRNAIVDRFLFDGHLKIAKEEKANLILSGELLGYERNTLRYDENNNVLEYRIHIVISMSLFDTAGKQVVWTEPSFVGETTYFVSGSQAKSESEAVQDALTDLARRVVSRTIEDW